MHSALNRDRSWTEIDLDCFRENLQELSQHVAAGTAFMQIVKADAYGHGAFQIARCSLQCGAAMLGVANADEGMLLRYQGIEAPILILSPSLPTEIPQILESHLTPSVSDPAYAQALQKASRQAGRITPVHVNIDTGMGRSGVRPEEALPLIALIRKMKHLAIEGVFSHYTASENDPDFTAGQLAEFRQIIGRLDFKPHYIHIANSSGILTQKDDLCNLVRTGLLSYGIYNDPGLRSKIRVQPVMTFKSRITFLKSALPGESIGYNRTYTAAREIRYGILPVGYADGYDFQLSNRGKVLIQKQICPVIGRVSMDMIAVDVTHLPGVAVGQDVILLGGGHEKVSAEYLCGLYQGSVYEMLCQVGRRARRYYREKGEISDSSPLLRREFVSQDYSDQKLNTIIEAAIEQRLQSKEIAGLLYNEWLQRFFAEKDSHVSYRRDFRHAITFQLAPNALLEDYYQVQTTLQFRKQLRSDEFFVACASNEQQLEDFFLRPDVEYRWLLDKNIDLDNEFFHVSSVLINDIQLENEIKISNGCIEIRCFHAALANLVGKEVAFSISTLTYYPRSSRQLSVYIIEMTRGLDITFDFGKLLDRVEVVPIFAGQKKFPVIDLKPGRVQLVLPDSEWVFPNSGVVFAY